MNERRNKVRRRYRANEKKDENQPSLPVNRGWIGEESELLNALSVFGADTDEAGKFLIYEQPVVKGLDGSIVIHGDTECSIGGRRANVAGLLKQTSYGLSVVVF